MLISIVSGSGTWENTLGCWSIICCVSKWFLELIKGSIGQGFLVEENAVQP